MRMVSAVLGVLDEAMSRTQSVLASVTDEQRRVSTPCSDFDVAGLAAHLVGGLVWLAGLPAGGTTNPMEVPEPDLAGRSLDGEFATAAGRARDAWNDEELAKVFTVAGNPVTGQDLVRFAVVEMVGHGWDIATATGQPTAGWDELAQTALDLAHGLDERILRAPGMMAPPVPVPADAPPLDRLIAFLGRDPQWSPDS